MNKFKTNRFGVKRRMVNQEEIVDFLKHNPGTPENSIMGSIYGFFRGSTRESNKKYADCLRRALHSGKIRREEVKGRSYKFIYFINDLPKVEIKNDFVYLDINKLINKKLKVMNQIKVVNKSVLLNLETEVQVGPLKATLEAIVISCDGQIDIEFSNIENVSYNDVPVYNFRAFRNMNKEYGIDYDSILGFEFSKVFTEKAVKEIIEGLK
jgi:hypothetical protein